jgi:acetylornithine deacetylase/succinyl-diaminopimelate desuccinylase-like protein
MTDKRSDEKGSKAQRKRSEKEQPKAGARKSRSPGLSKLDAESAVEFLRKYIAIDTTNPPGNEEPAAEFLASALETRSVSYRIFKTEEGRPNLVARLKAEAPGHGKNRKSTRAGDGSGNALCLMHHMDVVPADQSRWTHDPFGGEIADGAIWGRGALDMKSLGVMHLWAFMAVADAVAAGKAALKRDLLFVAVSDEEEGGRSGAAWLLENQRNAVACSELWTEGGSGVANAIPGVDVFACATTEKSVIWIKATATGKPGHGAIPPDAQATDKLFSFISKLRARNRRYRLVDETRVLYTNLASRAAGIERAALTMATGPRTSPVVLPLIARRLSPSQRALLSDLVTVTVLEAGYKSNVVPGKAAAVLDCRLLPDTDPDSFLEECRRIAEDYDVQIEVLHKDSAGGVSRRGELYAALERRCMESVPSAVFSSTVSPGFTDSRFWRRAGASCLGLLPALIPGDVLATIHGDDERIPIEEFERGLSITRAVVEDLVVGPNLHSTPA